MISSNVDKKHRFSPRRTENNLYSFCLEAAVLCNSAGNFQENNDGNEGSKAEQPDKWREDLDEVEDGRGPCRVHGEPVEGIVTHGQTESLDTPAINAVKSLHTHLHLVLLDLNTKKTKMLKLASFFYLLISD